MRTASRRCRAALCLNGGPLAAAGATSELKLAGSLTVGTSAKANLYAGGVLNLATAPAGSTCTVQGEVDMYGAAIATNTATVASVFIAGGGKLLSLAAAGSDTV